MPSATLHGGFGGYFTGQVDTAAATTAGANLNVAPGAAPTSPLDGDMWLDNATGLYVRVNSVTVGPLGTGGALTDLSDVTISGVATGDYLRKSAGDWVNVAGVAAADVTAGTFPAGTFRFSGQLLEHIRDGSTVTVLRAYGAGPQLRLASANGTEASPTATASSRTLDIYFRGYNGSGFAAGARIYAQTGSLWSGSNQEMWLGFQVTGAGDLSTTWAWKMEKGKLSPQSSPTDLGDASHRVGIYGEAGDFAAKVFIDSSVTLNGFAPDFARRIDARYSSSLTSGNDLSILGYIEQTAGTTGGPQGTEGYALVNNAAGNVALAIGTVGNAEKIAAGTAGSLRGVSGTVGMGNGTVGTITEMSALFAASAFKTGTGTITTVYGLQIEDQTVGATNYAIKTGAGIVEFGDVVTGLAVSGNRFGSATGKTATLTLAGASTQLIVAENVTDTTAKIARIGAMHYTNAEEPMALIVATSDTGIGTVQIGGGTSAFNAASQINFVTAADQTTPTGTTRWFIDSAGTLRVGADSSYDIATDTVRVQGIYADSYYGRSADQLLTGYDEMTTPVGTTSATLEDVSGSTTSITLNSTSEIVAIATFELETQSGAAPSTIAVALNIDGTDSNEHSRYLTGANDVGIGAITFRRTGIASGSRTIKLRFRRVTGSATPGINVAHIYAWTV